MLIAANWKMYKGPAEAAAFCLGLREHELDGVNVVICPPFVSLAVVVQLLAGTEIGVAAQNAHWEPEGPYTGEISAPMLRELGVYGVIVGHSERRQDFGDSDEVVGKRARGALAAGLFVIGCVGETEAERERGKTATPEQAQEAHAFVKSLLDAPVLYGGSVKPENAEELLAQPDVDGALVGGASLDPDSFASICRIAARIHS